MHQSRWPFKTSDEEPVASGSVGRVRSARPALAVYLALQPVAVVYYLSVSRSLWFFFDEWDFLATRSAGNVNDLFRAHHGHWSTLPILAYRALWATVGLHSYRPYLMLTITFHLVVAALLRTVMRRVGVSPWVATAAAAVFVFFGSGWQDILEAFQITFLGSLAFGLAHLLLADHDGPFDRRDWIGLAAGAAGLMCSGVSLTMVFVVGVASLARRGWRVAAFHVLPLVTAYLVWSAIVHPDTKMSFGSPGGVVADAFTLVRQSFAALGGVHVLGIAVVLVLVAGLVLLVRDNPERLRPAVPAAAMLAGALFFAITTVAGRADTAQPTITPSRYVYVVAALVFPALALAADTLARRWRLVGALLCVALVTTVVANIRTVKPSIHNVEIVDQATRRTLLAIPHLPIAPQLPPQLRPDPTFAPDVTIGWLLAASAAGRLPDPGPLTQQFIDTETLRLALRPLRRVPALATCIGVAHSTRVDVQAGDRLAPGPHETMALRYGQSTPLVVGTRATPAVTAVTGPIVIDVQPASGSAGSQLCTTGGGA